MFTRFLPLQVYGDFSRRSRAAKSAVLGPIWPNFELVRYVMNVLVTCQYEEDSTKNRGARSFTLYINFSDAQGQITGVGGRIWLKFELIQAFTHVLVTCKNQDDRIKNEGASVHKISPIISMGIFPDAQGQLTPQSLVRSGRISNSSEMLWMFSLSASMKKIRSKIKALECPQHFPIISLWEISVAMDTRVPIRSGPKPNAAFPPPQ